MCRWMAHITQLERIACNTIEIINKTTIFVVSNDKKNIKNIEINVKRTPIKPIITSIQINKWFSSLTADTILCGIFRENFFND